MYPRSGFRSGGTSAKTTLLETTLLSTPETGVYPYPLGAGEANLKSAGKRQESGRKAPHFHATHSFFNVAVESFVCCSAAFDKKTHPHCRKPNVAVQLLQCNFPIAAAQLLLSLGD